MPRAADFAAAVREAVEVYLGRTGDADAIPVQLQLVQPLVARGRRLDQQRELGPIRGELRGSGRHGPRIPTISRTLGGALMSPCPFGSGMQV